MPQKWYNQVVFYDYILEVIKTFYIQMPVCREDNILSAAHDRKAFSFHP